MFNSPHFLSILILVLSIFLTSLPYASPHFFPNVSSIPPNPNHGAWDGFNKLTGCKKSQNVTGLAKLKNYFEYFGYINNNTNLDSDDFDEALESAIKTFQLNFNLNVTGQLDDVTLKHIVRPRCGVADIINGTTTMNSGKTTSSKEINFQTVAHFSFFPGTPIWPESRRDLTYAFQPENQLPDSVKVVFSRAFSRWSDVVPMTFTETPSFSNADIRIGFFSGDHGDGEPFDGVLGTLAHAFSPPAGRLHLDGAENWVVDGDVSASTVTSAVDLESVAVHEIGHVLGLGHSSVEGAIMYPSIASRTRKVELASDDVKGIQSLYGSNPNYNGSSTATTTPTTTKYGDTSGCGSQFVGTPLWRVLLAVGLIFFAL